MTVVTQLEFQPRTIQIQSLSSWPQRYAVFNSTRIAEVLPGLVPSSAYVKMNSIHTERLRVSSVTILGNWAFLPVLKIFSQICLKGGNVGYANSHLVSTALKIDVILPGVWLCSDSMQQSRECARRSLAELWKSVIHRNEIFTSSKQAHVYTVLLIPDYVLAPARMSIVLLFGGDLRNIIKAF